MHEPLSPATVAAALAHWIAACRDVEDDRGQYERVHGVPFPAAEFGRLWLDADQADEMVIQLAIHAGEVQMARQFRHAFENWVQKYMAEIPEPAPQLRPTLVASDETKSPRAVKPAAKKPPRGKPAASRPPSGGAA